MRRLHLQRTTDISGVSGTGRVAEVVMFSSGKCAVAWTGKTKSVAVYDSISDLRAVHCHPGTTLVYDEPLCRGCGHPWMDHVGDNCGACETAIIDPIGGAQCLCVAMNHPEFDPDSTLPVGGGTTPRAT